MAVQIPLKTNPERDAQRQGHVGYSKEVIYPGEDNPYVVNNEPNGDRVKNIFSNDYTGISAQEIGNRMILNRLPSDGDDLNPDFALGSVSYNYQKDEVSNSFRAEDLREEGRKAPNVLPNNEDQYIEPFQTLSERKGGFGNEAEEGTLHKSSEGRLLAGLPDSIEVISKYP